MNTTQLECFLAVANHLNFSRAAEQLRITQPAVSHQINALEDELGAKLFHRTSKSVHLTQAGHLFLQYAADILNLPAVSKARLKKSQADFPQRFGIGCRNFLELRFLRGAMDRMRLEMPQVVPMLRMIPFASLDNLLHEGDIQVLLTLRDTAPAKAVYQELVRCPIVCVCGQDHPFAPRAQLTMRQLREGGQIAICPPSFYPPALFSIHTQVVTGRNPERILFCDNLDVVFALVQANYAFALTIDLPAARLPGLRYIPLPEFAPLSYGAAHLPGKKTSALRQFLAIAQSFASGAGQELPATIS